jgi:hypothetical protein
MVLYSIIFSDYFKGLNLYIWSQEIFCRLLQMFSDYVSSINGKIIVWIKCQTGRTQSTVHGKFFVKGYLFFGFCLSRTNLVQGMVRLN